MTATIRLRTEPLTQAAFAPFGFVMEAPADGMRTGPLPVIADTRPAAKVTATLIDLPAQRSPRAVRQVERHHHSSQFFLHLAGGGLSLVVFPTAADGQPDTAHARAFVAAPCQAFGYHPGIWHAGVAALGEPTRVASLLSRDGTPGDVEERALPAAIEVDWS
ncbi:MAG: ureidoglycolate lyase [Rhodospirillales bacterium]|nr:ureidoglycolate lyase [Rhodospirillales bacterium]